MYQISSRWPRCHSSELENEAAFSPFGGDNTIVFFFARGKIDRSGFLAIIIEILLLPNRCNGYNYIEFNACRTFLATIKWQIWLVHNCLLLNKTN